MGSRLPPRKLGQLGEDHAENELRTLGFAILGRNVRLRGVEFDLVARRGQELWFVEVKTRRDTRGGFPYEAIHDAKVERMESGALEFLESRALGDLDYRFVAASLVPHDSGDGFELEWIPLV